MTWILQNGIFMKNYMQEGLCIKEEKRDLASKRYWSCIGKKKVKGFKGHYCDNWATFCRDYKIYNMAFI